MRKFYLFFVIACLSSYFVYYLVNQNNKSYKLSEDVDIDKNEIINNDNDNDNNMEEDEYINNSLNNNYVEVLNEDISIEKTSSTNEKELMTLEIPKMDYIGKIYNKDSELNRIDKNIIIMDESDMPDKDGGSVIIGGHSGFGKYAFFRKLNILEMNDIVYLNYKDKKYTYQVVDVHLDYKDGSITVNNTTQKNKLFLYTCNPNDKNNFLVVVCNQIN